MEKKDAAQRLVDNSFVSWKDRITKLLIAEGFTEEETGKIIKTAIERGK